MFPFFSKLMSLLMIVDLLHICLLIHRNRWNHFHLIELSSIFKDKINCRCFWVDFKWPCIDDFHLVGDLLGEDLRVVGLDPAGEEEVFLDGFDDHVGCSFALVLVEGGELVGCFFVLHIWNKIYRVEVSQYQKMDYRLGRPIFSGRRVLFEYLVSDFDGTDFNGINKKCITNFCRQYRN